MQKMTYTPITNTMPSLTAPVQTESIAHRTRPMTSFPTTVRQKTTIRPIYRLPNAKYAFAPEALSNLSLFDRLLFEHFGQGPLVPVPHAAIHEAIAEQVRTYPDAVAVTHQGASLTYAELDRQANRLAAILADHGVTNGDNVGLFLQRSLPMIVGILATLKVGAAYVPQDARVTPEPQLRHIAATTGAKVVLTISTLRERIPVGDHQICIAVDELMSQPFANRSEYVAPFISERPVRSEDRCFILFTSGTTGNPNGVQVTHGNVGNILLTEPGDLGIRPGMKVGQILSIAFDMAAWEILGALSHGATLVIRGKDFTETASQVDVLIATPSILSTIDAAQCHNVKVVAVAGEPCPQPLAEKWAAFCTFYNSCGPTETTIVNTMQPYTPGSERLTIGKPTPNNTVYILNEQMEPCAIGEIGEMWAGGDCVTTGYLNNPELTNERYAPDPFLGNGHIMFRTRDLGRWTPDGELEHFGRTDDQVKVRGFRVELDSVSAALESVPNCKRAATLKLNDRYLVAFVSPNTVDTAASSAAVGEKLPYYCVPKFVIALEELPMTSRGKIDKKALLEIALEHDASIEQTEKE